MTIGGSLSAQIALVHVRFLHPVALALGAHGSAAARMDRDVGVRGLHDSLDAVGGGQDVPVVDYRAAAEVLTLEAQRRLVGVVSDVSVQTAHDPVGVLRPDVYCKGKYGVLVQVDGLGLGLTQPRLLSGIFRYFLECDELNLLTPEWIRFFLLFNQFYVGSQPL